MKNPDKPLTVRFSPDIHCWLEETAKRDGVKPETIIKERMRELAEHERAAREVA